MAAVILKSETSLVNYPMQIDCTFKDVLSMQNFSGDLRSTKLRNSDAGIQDPSIRWGEWQLMFHPHGRVLPGSSRSQQYYYVSLEYSNSTQDAIWNEFLASIKVSVVDEQANVISEWQVVGSSYPVRTPAMISASKVEGAQVWKGYSFMYDMFSTWRQSLSDQQKAELGRDFKYLVNGNLRIIADIHIFLPSEAGCRLPQTVPSLASQMLDSITCLFDSKAGADFILVSSEGKELPAHRSILIARSEVFKAMLTTDSKESQTGRCVADDCDDNTLSALLEFIYGREPANMVEIAKELLYAADKYQVLPLKDFCAEQLASTLTVENAAEVLILADNHAAALLRDRTISFIAANKKAFVESGGFIEILKHSNALGNELMARIV